LKSKRITKIFSHCFFQDVPATEYTCTTTTTTSTTTNSGNTSTTDEEEDEDSSKEHEEEEGAKGHANKNNAAGRWSPSATHPPACVPVPMEPARYEVLEMF
jgi:hypothetical protein